MEEQVTKLEPAVPQESDYTKEYGISRQELLGMWGTGTIGATPYVYLALKLDGHQEARKFDLGVFLLRWSAPAEMTLKGKKDKELTQKHFLAAIATLEEKGQLELTGLKPELRICGV